MQWPVSRGIAQDKDTKFIHSSGDAVRMSDLVLFTKPDCQKCDYIKKRLPEDVKIRIVDMTTADGMAEAAYYEILDKNLPILVADEEVVEGAINILSRINSSKD